MGEWLPHLWRNDEGGLEAVATDFIVIKFTRMFGGVDLFSIPELLHIKALLKEADQGLLFSKKTRKSVHEDLLKLAEAESSEKLILLLSVLQKLVVSKEYQTLSGPNFSLPKEVAGENRLHKVINHISANFARDIKLNDIAEIAAMTPPAFCRFFKTRTNKTFSLFLNEVRISKACQLLINGEAAINQICYDVGFSSLTNFNRTFKSFKGISPSSYRDSYSNFRQHNFKEVS
ncbi:AraC family transcriptional regulator [Flagellimonas algicola]|uniref:AraC family transcriptional regulator n=1 Tax=Flagellimonas algicola TaxID=2583815 RepID=UPI001F345EEE|nr:AraC family transcriptional regulator [Allomuricauda algicola]